MVVVYTHHLTNCRHFLACNIERLSTLATRSIGSVAVLSCREAVAAQNEHACIACLKGDANILSDVEALSEECSKLVESSKLIESKISVHLSHAICEAMYVMMMHVPSGLMRWAAM